MLTLRGSAALLATARSIDGLTALAHAIGFDGAAASLDNDLRSAIGLPAETVDAAVVPGAGALRCLVLSVSGGPPVRDTLALLAARLASHTPHVLWLILTADIASDVVAVGVPGAGPRRPRVAALVVSRARVMDSDAETVRLLAAAHGSDDLGTHGRFIEILGRDSLSRQFFRTLEQCVGGLALSANRGAMIARREIALLYASRLLFLGFLEAKGWLNGDPAFLTRVFDECMATGGGFHSRVMLPLFFGTLNTPTTRRAQRASAFGRIPFLNGGLFTPTSVERQLKPLRFGDDAIGRFVGELFSRYRFTAREGTTSFEEAAIDPEMLGRTFECLMVGDSRLASGAFYTPHELVERITACGLEQALGHRLGGHAAEELVRTGSNASPDALAALMDLRVLDPACGSGAFLVHVLDRVANLRHQCGDPHPMEAIRRNVLARSIFGVDINPTAVWLCQLRLWLSIVIDTPGTEIAAVAPLPNLDRNIRVGDSLSGDGFGEQRGVSGGVLRGLRERYSRATGARKAALSRMLDREERRLLIQTMSTDLAGVSACRRDLVTARRGRDLFGGRYQSSREEAAVAAGLRRRSADLRRRIRSARSGGALPFSFPVNFADVAAAGGFSLIVGNPPWVRPHRIDSGTRERLRRRFTVAGSAPWAAGAEAAGAGRGFSAQVDLAALFVERSLRLLAPGAPMSLLLPSKLWRSLAGGGLRRLMTEACNVIRIEDYSEVPTSFDAAVYPGLLVAARRSISGGNKLSIASPIQVSVLHRSRTATSWTSHLEECAWDESSGAPWILLPPDVRRTFDRIRNAGVPLASSIFGRPILGVKCGLNEAFIVTGQATVGGLTCVSSANGRRGRVEPVTLRPVVRGEGVKCWTLPVADQSIIWPHDMSGRVLPSLPPGLASWLSPYRRSLIARADARSGLTWWTLFRTEAARCDKPRVIWADIGRSPRATVVDAGDPTVPLNSCYVARCPTGDDALALAALINSPLVASWLSVVAEPARGGYRRYLGWTMSLLPVPIAWETHRPRLVSLAVRARQDPNSVTRVELLDAAIEAFGLTRRSVEPLLTWTAP